VKWLSRWSFDCVLWSSQELEALEGLLEGYRLKGGLCQEVLVQLHVLVKRGLAVKQTGFYRGVG
jgi:hypothetical protein